MLEAGGHDREASSVESLGDGRQLEDDVFALPALLQHPEHARQLALGTLDAIDLRSHLGGHELHPIEFAAGTSLVVIAVTSMTAPVARLGAGLSPDWNVGLVLTAAAAIGGLAGATLANRIDARRLGSAFTAVVIGVGVYTAIRAVPALA